MKKVILALVAILMLSTIVAAGDFKIQYPFGTNVFLVSKDGDTNATNLNVLTKLDASLATVSFATDALSESYINFDTSCGAGNHLYISGDNLACEPNDGGMVISDYPFMLGNDTAWNDTWVGRDDWTTIDDYPNACPAGEVVTALGDTLTCVADNPGNTTEEIQDAAGLLAGTSLTYDDGGNAINVDDDFVKNVGDDITGSLNFGADANVTLNEASRITGGGDSWIQMDGTGNVVILLS